jgi:tetratricopeptide (TPR) repeat protein
VTHNLGLSLFHLERYDEALSAYLKTLKLLPKDDPKHVDINIKIAEICAMQKHWKCSSDHFGQSWKLSDQKNPTVLKNYVNSLFNVNDIEAAKLAVDVLESSDLDKPDDIRFQCEYGVALVMIKKLKKGHQILSKCRKKSPNDYHLHVEIGLRLADYEPLEAIKHFEIITKYDDILLKSYQKNAVIYKLGHAYHTVGK